MARIGLQLSCLLAVFFLWDTILLYPFKLLVVFFHELSHGMAAVLTGGEIVKIEVVMAQGGVCYTQGGWRFFILSAGYLGSLFWGCIIYLGAVTSRQDRALMNTLGSVVLLVALIWVRNWFGFGFCLFISLFMLFCANKMPEKVNDFMLRIIGLTSMMYAPLDIYSDTIERSYLRASDAARIAQEYWGTTVFWGGLWLSISVAVMLVCLWIGLKEEAG